MNAAQERWPELPYSQWTETRETLHRWLQVVGKVRLTKTRWVNHGWHSTFYVTSRGLTTGLIHDINRSFSIEFDFIEHCLRLHCSDGGKAVLSLESETVAAFHGRCFAALADLGIRAKIHDKPNEMMDALPFTEDRIHRTYDPEFASRFWRALLQADRLFNRFRSDFVGKVSPVHFFWGSLDLAVTRFSGRRAPDHPGGFPNLPDRVAKEAYSHEVSSCGFWPGNDVYPQPAFYSYAYPMPSGFDSAKALPKQAIFHERLREFLLPYDEVRNSSDPDRMVTEFLQSTYDAAANLGRWDRESLEDSPLLRQLQKAA